MNRLCVQLPFLTIMLATVLAATDALAFSQSELEAKLVYCKTCHGLSGEGYRGSTPMPRLAGQQPDYLENQLRAFMERRRDSKFMFGVVSALGTAMLPAVAAHFKDLNPRPLKGASSEIVATGKKLYEEGVPGANIPPCAMCHGPDAKGQSAAPRLAGQLRDYTAKTLMHWTRERCRDRANAGLSMIMEPIASGLTEPQVDAIAAYLNQLD